MDLIQRKQGRLYFYLIQIKFLERKRTFSEVEEMSVSVKKKVHP